MSIIMPSGHSSTGRPDTARELFGRQLRLLRESRRIGRDVAGRHLDGSESKISRIELGRIGVKGTDLDRLLTLYGIRDAQERLAMLELGCRLNDRQWWHAYSDVLPGWFCSYLVFESVAEHIRTYEVRFIPGLLQTKAYAEAVIRLQYADEAEIRRRVDVRMQRQRMVFERKTPQLWAVIDEAALYERIGGPGVMREQIEFLIHAIKRMNVQIQVLPSGIGGHAGIGNSFSMLRLRISDLSDVVYLEQIDSALFLGHPDESDPYELAMTRISLAARYPQKTMAILEQARRHDHSAPGGSGLASS